MSDVLKALSDPTRRQILALLRDRSRCAGEISDQFNLTKPTISSHLSVLREAGLISGVRDGTTIIYHLNLSVLEESLMGLMQLMKIDPTERQPHGKPDRRKSKA